MANENTKKATNVEYLNVCIPGFTYTSKGPLQIDKIVYSVKIGNKEQLVYKQLVFTEDLKIDSHNSVLATKVLYSNTMPYQTSDGSKSLDPDFCFNDYITTDNNGELKHIINPVFTYSVPNTQITNDNEGTAVKPPVGNTTVLSDITGGVVSAKESNCFGIIPVGVVWDVDIDMTFEFYSYLNVKETSIVCGDLPTNPDSLTTGSWIKIGDWKVSYNPAATHLDIMWNLLKALFLAHLMPKLKDITISSPSSEGEENTLRQDLDALLSGYSSRDLVPNALDGRNIFKLLFGVQTSDTCKFGYNSPNNTYWSTMNNSATIPEIQCTSTVSDVTYHVLGLITSWKGSQWWHGPRNDVADFFHKADSYHHAGYFGLTRPTSGYAGDKTGKITLASQKSPQLVCWTENALKEDNIKNKYWMALYHAKKSLVTLTHTISLYLTNDKLLQWGYLFNLYPYFTFSSPNDNSVSADIGLPWQMNWELSGENNTVNASSWNKGYMSPLTLGAYMGHNATYALYLALPRITKTPLTDPTLEELTRSLWYKSYGIDLSITETYDSIYGESRTNNLRYATKQYHYPKITMAESKIKSLEDKLDGTTLNMTTLMGSSNHAAVKGNWRIHGEGKTTSTYYNKDLFGKIIEPSNNQTVLLSTGTKKLYVTNLPRKFDLNITAELNKIHVINNSCLTKKSFYSKSFFILRGKVVPEIKTDNSKYTFSSNDIDREYIPYIYNSQTDLSGINIKLTSNSVRNVNVRFINDLVNNPVTVTYDGTKGSPAYTSLNVEKDSYTVLTKKGDSLNAAVKIDNTTLKLELFNCILKINGFVISKQNGPRLITKSDIKINNEQPVNGCLLFAAPSSATAMSFNIKSNTSDCIYIASITCYLLEDNWTKTIGKQWYSNVSAVTYCTDPDFYQCVVLPVMFCAAENIELYQTGNWAAGTNGVTWYPDSSKTHVLLGVHMPVDNEGSSTNFKSYFIAGLYFLENRTTVNKILLLPESESLYAAKISSIINSLVIRTIPTTLSPLLSDDACYGGVLDGILGERDIPGTEQPGIGGGLLPTVGGDLS